MTGPSITVKVQFRTCRRRKADAKPEAAETRVAPIRRRIALAHYLDAAIERGELGTLAGAAMQLRLTRARLTQISDLALLAPDIQEAVLTGACEPRDRHLRAVGRHLLWKDQRQVFAQMFPHVSLGVDHDQRHADRDLSRN